MKNFGHHDEFEQSGLTIDDIAQKIKDRKIFYNHFTDKENQNKWKSEDLLKIIDSKLLPEYLLKNFNKFDNWLAK